jgi:hypothetical protein
MMWFRFRCSRLTVVDAVLLILTSTFGQTPVGNLGSSSSTAEAPKSFVIFEINSFVTHRHTLRFGGENACREIEVRSEPDSADAAGRVLLLK